MGYLLWVLYAVVDGEERDDPDTHYAIGFGRRGIEITGNCLLVNP